MGKFILLLVLFFSFLSVASPIDNDKDTIGCDGGSGTSGTINGDGIPGCDGGTDPDKYGKFYLKGTKQECNPSQCDLNRSNKNKQEKLTSEN